MSTVTVTGETLAAFNESQLSDPFAVAAVEAEKAETKAKEIKAAEAKNADPKEELQTKEELKAEEVDDEAKEDKPKKGKLATRFSELTGKARAAEERAAAAEAKLAELEGKKAKEAPAANKTAPDPKNFTDFDDYTDAVAEWKADKKLAEREANDRKAKEEAAAGEVVKSWNTRIESAKERYADFHEIISSSSLEYEPVVRKILMESEYGPDVLYHLSNDDEDAAKFAKMGVDQRVKFIGRLEGKLEELANEEPEDETPVKAEKPKPKLPTPITPIKSKNISHDPINSPGEFKGSYQEYKAQRMKNRA